MTDRSWLTARPIAHRGLHDGNRTRFENTLSAFSAAMDAGYAIECDVHLSADHVPMVFHDASLERLTGEAGFIWDREAAALSRLRLGPTSDHVPTLREMLALVAGRTPVVVELKAAQDGNLEHDGKMVEQVADALKAYQGPVAVMSFEHRFVRSFAKRMPNVMRGLTAEGKEEEVLEEHFSMLAHQLDFVSYSVSDLPNAFVGFVRGELGLPVITWTVRDAEAARRSALHADQMTFEGFLP